MMLHEVQALVRELMGQHLDDTWRFEFDTSKKRAGACHFHGYNRRTRTTQGPKITLSRDLMALWPESEVRNTILHEIAHALAGPRHGHDETWRRIAVGIGCTGERCYSGAELPSVATPWVGTCPNGHTTGRHKRPTKVQSCGRCSRRFDRAYLITWTRRGATAPAVAPEPVLVEVAASAPAPRPTRTVPQPAAPVPASVQESLF